MHFFPLLLAVALLAQAQTPPKITSGVEILAVDVQVVDKQGFPFPRLGPGDFEVSIDGRRRRVLSADIIKHVGPQNTRTPSIPEEEEPAADRPAPTGRLFVVAVDEHSFPSGAAKAAMEAVRRFVENLRPDDLVGLYAYPTSGVQVDLTSHHASILPGLDRITGLYEAPRGEFHMSLTEISDISSGDGSTLAQVVTRECRTQDTSCSRRVRGEAQSFATFYEAQVAQSLNGLYQLFQALARIPQKKTVVLVSGGLIANDRPGGRPNLNAETTNVGRAAALANINLFVLHMDSSFLDAYSSGTRVSSSLMSDTAMTARGLEMIAGAGGGSVVRVEAGTADAALERLTRETSVYYLLGLEVTDAERDGRVHSIQVRVKQRGAIVRNRTGVVIPR
ncbi:MAG TPA: VWA domain-containing protein [Vicinamibacterales bacterium]